MTAPPHQTQAPNPRVGIGVFLIHPPTRTFLLGHRINSLGHDTWALPGGHLEFGEGFEECAAREVWEETGIDLLNVGKGKEGIKFWTATNSVMEGKHYVTVFMVVDVAELGKGEGKGEDERVKAEVKEPEKCRGWEWVSWGELRGWGGVEGEGVGDGKEEGRRLFQPMRDLLVQREGEVPEGL